MALALLLAVAAATQASPSPDRSAAARAARWLERQPPASLPGGQQADAIVALRAAGAPPRGLRSRLRRLSRLAPSYAVTAGGAAKVALAAAAAGVGPRLGGVDYLARVGRAQRSGRLGTTLWDHALSMLALRAHGRRVPRSALSTLRLARGGGGWGLGLAPGGRDSVDATALALEALAAAGVRPRTGFVRSATRWMLRQRNRSGGFASAGAGGPTEANSTAAAIVALRSLGIRPPRRSSRALRALQRADGAVRFTARAPGSLLLATLDALRAFSGAGRVPVGSAR